MCAADPPSLKGAEKFQRGALATSEQLSAWWRQDPQKVQLVVALPEDASFKRDVHIELKRTSIELTVSGEDVLIGELPFDIHASESEWFVEEELDGFQGADDDARYLVVELFKRESFVDWPAPLQALAGTDRDSRRLLIGGSGEAQKQGTAQQLASYQILQKLPSAVRGDVYARAPPRDADGLASSRLYFVGKVIAETASPSASLGAQDILVKEHARLYLPDVFGGMADEELELWLAPGNTEVRVAQNEFTLKRWETPGPDVALPAAGACGFEPETAPPAHMGAEPFYVKRDLEGRPLGEQFQANIISPDQVPGAYGEWLKDQ